MEKHDTEGGRRGRRRQVERQGDKRKNRTFLQSSVSGKTKIYIAQTNLQSRMTRKKCSALGEAGRRTVCLVSGGDGGDLVRPAALPWSVTSSPGPWYCGHSTKPCRGHRETTRDECGGGIGCVRGCRCE